MPSVEDLLGGRSRGTTELIDLLNEKFGGNIAPLLLLTRESVLDIEGIGPRRRDVIESHLSRYDLRFRELYEKVSYRAGKLYRGLDKVPVEALYVYVEFSEGCTLSHYLESSIIGILSKYAGGLTLGELTKLTRLQVADLILGRDVSIDKHRLHQKLDELGHRLASWDLSLARSTKTAPIPVVK